MKEESSKALNRREFIRNAGLGTALSFSILPTLRGADSPNNKIVAGVMGTSRNSIGGDGRGTELAKGFASLPNVEVRYVCDVDSRNIDKAIESVVTKTKQTKPPKGVSDFRRILDDKDVDILVIATPDHWHAPATILGCAAGKHVYVEKPCCHNPREGELMVAAARKHNRHVQHGTQRRSWPATIEAVQRLRAGEIGRVLFVKCTHYGARPTIGRGKPAPVPEWLDYSLWQGPAPEREYRDNVVHYNWHWFWHWGTSEIGNNGVHTIDVARLGLGVDYPLRVSSSGGHLRFDDDQETPDTNIATFDFGNCSITWEGRSWSNRTHLEPECDIAFHGENGVLAIKGAGFTIYDRKGQEIGKRSGNGGEATHMLNLLDAIRNGSKLNAEIEEGYKSTLLCHLANIAYRTGHTLHLDPKTHGVENDKRASALWGREYRKGWEVRV